MPKLDKTRYKEQLLDMRQRLTGEVSHLIASVPERIQGAGELSHVPTHNADRDSEGLDKELAVIHNEENLLESVDGALARIEEGTFGTCQNCGRQIIEARLAALPYTPYCIQCAHQMEQANTPAT